MLCLATGLGLDCCGRAAGEPGQDEAWQPAAPTSSLLTLYSLSSVYTSSVPFAGGRCSTSRCSCSCCSPSLPPAPCCWLSAAAAARASAAVGSLAPAGPAAAVSMPPAAAAAAARSSSSSSADSMRMYWQGSRPSTPALLVRPPAPAAACKHTQGAMSAQPTTTGPK